MSQSIIDQVQTLVDIHKQQPGALLPLLHSIQGELGFIPPDVVPTIAKGLNLSRAEVHGVITYYHFFRQSPAGRHVVQLCRAEACQARGSDALVARAEEIFGCKMHETRADLAITLEPVYCLGLCASSPAIAIDERPYARMTAEKLERLAGQIMQIEEHA